MRKADFLLNVGVIQVKLRIFVYFGVNNVVLTALAALGYWHTLMPENNGFFTYFKIA